MESGDFFARHLETVSRLAREAGALLRKRAEGEIRVEHKGVVDLVTDADRASEEFLVGALYAAYPDYSIIAEEGGGGEGAAPYTWVLDPLDGTTNFAHGFPFWCVSIALVREGSPVLGVVYDPLRDELFTAVRGAGSFLNGRRLAVSRQAGLDNSLLATGFPYDIRTSAEKNLDHFTAFALCSQAIRRAGSAALDLCYIGAGRFDGYWELKLKPWDMAAGALVVTEAGGQVTDISGGPFALRMPGILASNGLIHDRMLDILNRR